LLFAIGPAAYVLFSIFRWVPGVVEAVYRNALSPAISMVLSTLTRIVPIALGEILVLAVLLWYATVGTIAIRDTIRGLRQAKNAVAAGVLRIARDTGVIIGLFYLLWGFNYALPPLADRLGWQPLQDVSVDELAGLAEETLSATNAEYIHLHGTDDTGAPTELPENLAGLEDAIREGWRVARQRLEMPAYPNGFGRVKNPTLTGMYEWLGIAGYYNPFTAEGNVRAGIPAIDYPRILAHEMTHQRGVARENEANFWAYLAAANSDDALARYSAFRFVQGQLLVELARVDVERAQQMIDLRIPGVQRDIDDSRRYWQQFRGRGTAIGSSVNNAFLRSNRVEGGIRSYSMSAFLFLAYARGSGGSIVPARHPNGAPNR
jgi:hypothetical protein